MLVQGARLVVDRELLIVDGDKLARWGSLYIHTILLFLQLPLVATNDLARQLPRAALALARIIPLVLVI